MCPYTVIALAVIGSVIVLAIVSLFSSAASEKDFRERLALAMSDPELRWNEKKHTFQYRGLNFFYRKYAGSRNSPPSFSVTTECRGTGGEYEVSGEDCLERLFKTAGIDREVQTPEEEFNGRFYIASDTPRFAQDYFAFAEKREAVKRIFDWEASTVTHKGQHLTVTWKGSSAHADGVAGMQNAIEALAVLAKDIPPCPDAASSAVLGSGPSFNRVLVTVVAAASLAAGIVSVLWTSASYPVFDVWRLFLFPLKFSLPALAVFLYFAVTTLAGNSRSHRDILTAGSLALAGFLMLGCGLTGLYNGMKDLSPPAGHTALVVDKWIHSSKGSKTYKLAVRSWRPGNAVENITTNKSAYQKIVPGNQKVMIYTKPGKLGFEWFVSYRLLP